MTTLIKVLTATKYAETTETIQYTSKDCVTTIDKATATNVTAANVIISVSLVKSGDTAGVSNRITYNKTIAPGAVYTFTELVTHVLEAGDFISTICNTASALVIKFDGRQFT